MITNKTSIKTILEEWYKTLVVADKPNEYETKNLLHALGINVPNGMLINGKEAEVTHTLKAPYVVKVCSAEILHKTDRGGVLLNVTEDTLTESVKEIKTKFPDEYILIEEMVSYRGTEFIVGGLVDPVFGSSIMVGAGGILTEVYKDVVFRLAPCSMLDAQNMLDELLISPVLNGYRGISMDKEGLAHIINTISILIEVLGDSFSQMDINPLVFDGSKWVILDALLELNG